MLTKKEWFDRYKQRLIENGFTSEEAAANAEAIMPFTGEDSLWSLDENPEDSADAETAEWHTL